MVNSNDLGSGLRRALEDQSGYYLLGYVLPAGSLAHNNRFHRIKVEVKRRDVRVRARPGFYGGPRTTSRTRAHVAVFARRGGDGRFTPYVNPWARRQRHHRGYACSCTSTPTACRFRVGWLADHDARCGWPHSGHRRGGRAASGWRYDFRARVDEHAKTLAQGLLYRNQIVVKRPGYYRSQRGRARLSSGTLGTASQFIEVPDLGSGGALRSRAGRPPGERRGYCGRAGLRARRAPHLRARGLQRSATVARARRPADVGGASTAPRRPGGPVTARRPT